MWKVIERLMKEKGMTPYSLAKAAGITKQGLYALRDGRTKTITLEYAFKVADALDVDVNEFRKEN